MKLTISICFVILCGCAGGSKNYYETAMPRTESFVQENPCETYSAHKVRAQNHPIVIDGVSYFCF